MISFLKTQFRFLRNEPQIPKRNEDVTNQMESIQAALHKTIIERDTLQASHDDLLKKAGFVPPGHYYSPIPALDDIQRDESTIFSPAPPTLAGIDMRESEQLRLLEHFRDYYPSIPFEANAKSGLRYYYDNQSYSYSDAICLHCMIRYLQPKKIIEVGSGFSSCVTLDTNELFFNHSIATTFIEPYPELFSSLIKGGDTARVRLLPSRLQDVDLAVFDQLGANDILFIDSTHVSKVNSDVNRVFFDILPRLASGVHIHFHDIFYPFEYPKDWIYSGIAWNEAYLLRSFLQFNPSFSIVLMNTFMEHFHEPFFEEHMPLCLKNPGGSIWLRKE
jgi:hypothetical protein